jgi:DNA-binding response OmpR family regulator
MRREALCFVCLRAAPLLRCGEVELDPAARRVRRAGEPVEISAKELAILEALMANAGRIMSRGKLESLLYGWGEGAESNAVEVFIHHLRRKLGHGFIRTLRGIGYMVEKDSRAPAWRRKSCRCWEIASIAPAIRKRKVWGWAFPSSSASPPCTGRA